MHIRYSFNKEATIGLLLMVLIIPPALAGGAGAGFGDYGDFGVSEGARMGANPYYSGLMAGNLSATSTTPRVLTPLPTATPFQKITPTTIPSNKTTTNATKTENRTNATIVTDNYTNVKNTNITFSDNESEIQGKDLSMGDLIRAGDWGAIDAYQDRKRAEQSNFLDTTRANQSSDQSSSLDVVNKSNQTDLKREEEDDSIVTVVYPCS